MSRLLRWIGGLVVVAAVIVSHTPRDAAAQQQGSLFYGINNVAPVEPWMTIARESGARVVRWQFNWRDYEWERGQWDWTSADGSIALWREAGLEVHALLHTPPDYALVYEGGLQPINIDLPWDHPDNYWARYCQRFAARYKGQIHSYEIWNEPDLNQFWEGTADQYFDLMRTCYRAIRAEDQDTPITMAGMSLLEEPDFFPRVVELAAQHPDGPFFDIANIHMYSDPEMVYSLTKQTQWVLEEHGMGDMPIWITETNIALRGYGRHPDRPTWAAVTEEEAGWYMLQAIGYSHATDVEKFMVFRLADDGMNQAFGLVANDQRRRPSYTAMQIASEYLTDIVEATRQDSGDLVTINMRRADGSRVVMMWTLSGQAHTATIPAASDSALLIDPRGGTATINPNNDDTYIIDLPAAPGRNFDQPWNYTVGGPTYILFEFDTKPPSASLDVAVVELGGEVRLSWAGTDGGFGTGTATYDVQISNDGLTWEDWETNTTQKEATFDTQGRVYYFRVRATDAAGNVGAYSAPVAVGERPVALLSARVIDLRGNPVPFARLQLGDGTQFQADRNGRLEIEMEPGPTTFVLVDGGDYGVAEPAEVINLEVGGTYVRQWELRPRDNLLTNSRFSEGLTGWETVTDAFPLSRNSINFLRIEGTLRPWGAPAIWQDVQIPPEMQGAVLSFRYRMPDPGQQFQIRVIGEESGGIVWRQTEPVIEVTDGWVDLSHLTGQQIRVRFELVGEKGADPTFVDIDDIILGSVPQGEQ